jgi:serine acetyltransferase
MANSATRLLIRADWRANNDSKARFVLTGFRLAHAVQSNPSVPAPVRLGVVAMYKLATEWVLGIELPPRTTVGGGLRLYHGVGTVIHERTVIGRNVIMRHGVTLGHARPGGGCPVVGDGVEFGAGAIVIGDIRIGANAVIGAGAVVTHDVPANSVAVGNPARISDGEV